MKRKTIIKKNTTKISANDARRLDKEGRGGGDRQKGGTSGCGEKNVLKTLDRTTLGEPEKKTEPRGGRALTKHKKITGWGYPKKTRLIVGQQNGRKKKEGGSSWTRGRHLKVPIKQNRGMKKRRHTGKLYNKGADKTWNCGVMPKTRKGTGKEKRKGGGEGSGKKGTGGQTSRFGGEEQLSAGKGEDRGKRDAEGERDNRDELGVLGRAKGALGRNTQS